MEDIEYSTEMETLTDRNSYVKATNKDGFCILEATAVSQPAHHSDHDACSHRHTQSWCSQCR